MVEKNAVVPYNIACSLHLTCYTGRLRETQVNCRSERLVRE